MAARRRPADGEARLDPVRWRVPHRGALLRVGLAAGLLLIAAGALHPRDGVGVRQPTGSPASTAATAPGVRASVPAAAGAPAAGPANAPGPANPTGPANAVPAGPANAGPANAGPGNAGPGNAGPGNAGPGNAGPGNAGPGDVPAPANAGGPAGAAGWALGGVGPPVVAGAAGPPVGDRLPVPAGSVGVPVRVVESATVAVVRPGDRVDLVAVAAGGQASTVAADALVLGVAADGEPGAALYLALTRAQAGRAVAAPAHTRFAALVRP